MIRRESDDLVVRVLGGSASESMECDSEIAATNVYATLYVSPCVCRGDSLRRGVSWGLELSGS